MKIPSDSTVSRVPTFEKVPILVSACLLGLHCRYDGREKGAPALMAFAPSARFIPFCPEQLGGLPTPRPPAHIKGGDGRDVIHGRAKVLNEAGENVTRAFLRGAAEGLHLARTFGAGIILLKDKSPSCGIHSPYCESPSGEGMGVAAALFARSGYRILEIGPDDSFPPKELIEWIGKASPSPSSVLPGERQVPGPRHWEKGISGTRSA
ncbi:MAG: DUF523 domain-containing protein [Deltaproteobacteria bacterium]|nr:DUF523 domain-containing protein [Deltaproteobacteria bacterium]MBW2016850.1 DUF523 domain-containing protein [Deltaproteobacteria bacterium]MBW2130444.1 DUF523 domain-containing protein [Deltaproteobacteria bacterium]